MNPDITEDREILFIKEIEELLNSASVNRVDLSNDCAYYNGILITTDQFIEGVHFDLSWSSYEDVAIKAVNGAVSDIFACGNVPEFLTLSVAFREEQFKAVKDRFITAFLEECKRLKVTLVGGDTSRADRLYISLSVISRSFDVIIDRAGASPGDIIYLSDRVGSALGGYLAIKDGAKGYQKLIDRFKKPRISLDIVKRILKNRDRITSMIDISDGVIYDLSRILSCSGCGAVIDYRSIPTESEFISFCQDKRFDPVELALASGEEYVLLFTSKDCVFDNIAYKIGWITEEKGIKIKNMPQNFDPERWIFKHFKKQEGLDDLSFN